MPTTSAQMNVRIDSSLKSEGDSVFNEIGLTPSGAVRSLYQLAVNHRYEPEKVLELLEANNSFATDTNGLSKTADEGRLLYQNARSTLGLSTDYSMDEIPYEELRELSLMERFGTDNGE